MLADRALLDPDGVRSPLPPLRPAVTAVILTFDDGPSEWTGPILDLLAEHRTHAIFFVTGQTAFSPGANRATVKRAAAEGHTVGNHGWSHTRLTDLDDEAVREELTSTSDIIEAATGRRPAVFRAPYFGTDERVNAIADKLGLAHVGASVVPDDWCKTDAEQIARIVLDEIRPGAVVSLHDGIPPDGGSSSCTASRQPTVDAVRLILEGLAA